MRPNECAKAFVSPITQLAILPEAQTTALQGRLLKKKTCPEPFSCTCSVALSKWVAGANKTIWISVYLPCMKFSEGGSPRTCSWQLWSSPQGESRVFAPLSFHSLHQDVFISGSCMLRSVQRMGQNPSLLKNLLNELRVEDLYLPGLQRGEKKRRKKKKMSSSGSWELLPHQQQVTRAVRNIFGPRTLQDIAGPGEARSLLFCHALRKERIPVSDKQDVGKAPAA